MNPLDMIVNRTQAEQIHLVKKLRLELAPYGYSIVKTDRLKPLLAKVPLVDRFKTMLVD
jgi:hypothetical protein